MARKEYSFGIIPLIKKEENWEVLLIRHKGGHWSFPKGHAQDKETPVESASRELKEETGLNVVSFLPASSNLEEKYFFTFKGEKIYKTVTYFLALVEGEITLQYEEVIEAKWTQLKEAEKHVTFSEAKKICKQLCKILS